MTKGTVSERAREGYEPCPLCKQYSHSLGDDQIADAFRYFQSMDAHPVRGHPMGHVFDDATRDAAQVLVAAASEIRREAIEQCAKMAEATAAYDDGLQRSAGCSTTGQRIAHAIRAILNGETVDPPADSA